MSLGKSQDDLIHHEKLFCNRTSFWLPTFSSLFHHTKTGYLNTFTTYSLLNVFTMCGLTRPLPCVIKYLFENRHTNLYKYWRRVGWLESHGIDGCGLGLSWTWALLAVKHRRQQQQQQALGIIMKQHLGQSLLPTPARSLHMFLGLSRYSASLALQG